MSEKCVHCGSSCPPGSPVWDGKAFCCNGCLTVYQLLNENKLFKYYEYAENPGIRVDEQTSRDFAFLDNAEIRGKLLEFSDGGISKVTLLVPSIHCSSCIWLLEHLEKLHKGVVASSVNFPKKLVTITFRDEQVSLRQLAELLASIHYIPKITLDQLDRDDDKAIQSDRALAYRLGVAGFCFGNIMMFSLPEYLPGGQWVAENFQQLFRWANLVLALPVFFFAGNDYLLSALKGIRSRMLNIDLPVAVGMAAIFVQSTWEIVSGTGQGYMDSLAGFVFFLLIGKWYQNKTYQALSFERDYKSYFPIAVTRLEQDQEAIVPLEQVREGDLLLIRNNELIPADSTLARGVANIDYSFVTGESVPIAKQIGEPLFAGGRQKGAAIEVLVDKPVRQSRLTELWNQDAGKEPPTRLAALMDQVSARFTGAVLVVSVLTAAFWLWHDASVALRAFTSVLIVACPCALALSVPFTFGSVMRFFGRHGLYLKSTDVVEKLASVDTVVFDKTGTITRNDRWQVRFQGPELGEERERLVRSVARQSSHPVSVALARHFERLEPLPVERFDELPAKGIEALVGGRRLRLGSAAWLGAKVEAGLGSQAFLELDGELLGHFEVRNVYRDGWEGLASSLSRDKELHLLSGDNEAERERLAAILPQPENLRFNQSPQDKLERVRALEAAGKRVLMVGDGLNDAGALRESTAGIAVADDIHHFSPACDAILEARRFDRLQDLLLFSKLGIKVVKTSFGISIVYNLVGLYFAVTGQLSPIIAAILMPASSVTVVGFVTAAVALLARRRL